MGNQCNMLGPFLCPFCQIQYNITFSLCVCVYSLSGCQITEKGCPSLASALTSNPIHLQELDLNYNHLGDFGAMLLTAKLEDPQCRLEALRYGEPCFNPEIYKEAPGKNF